jgi:hypothetical protein
MQAMVPTISTVSGVNLKTLEAEAISVSLMPTEICVTTVPMFKLNKFSESEALGEKD